jgi:hypothetical protein
MAEAKYDPEALDQSLAELVLAAQAARGSNRGGISSGYERRSLTGWSTNGVRMLMRAYTGTNKRCWRITIGPREIRGTLPMISGANDERQYAAETHSSRN